MSTTNRFRPLLPAFAVLLVACKLGGGSVEGSGNVKTESRAVSGISAIELAGVGDLRVTQSGTESLSVEAEGNLLPLLTSAVSDGKLVLDSKGSIHPTRPIHYVVTVKDLRSIEVSGVGGATVAGLDATALSVVISGAGGVTVAGKAQSENVTISGAGSYDGSQLVSKSATVTQSGVGKGVVNVSDTLAATISGVGDVEYIGDPRVTENTSGLGHVHKR